MFLYNTYKHAVIITNVVRLIVFQFLLVVHTYISNTI